MRYKDTISFLKELDVDKKYCFILGAGASISSGIPAAQKLAEMWINEITASSKTGDIKDEIDRRVEIIEEITKCSEIKSAYEKFKELSYVVDLRSDLDDYNRICELRFMGDKNIEREYMYDLMKNKVPYVGYWGLANVLTRTNSRFVITTNFDELIETAINDFTSVHPIIVSHEAVSKDISIELMRDRPWILKIHRDIVTGPFNTSEKLKNLHDNWKVKLKEILQTYIPIVIGYAGTDTTLTDFLLNEVNGQNIYWCHMYGELPNSNAKRIVNRWNGSFVEIWEFDHIMLHISSILCSDDLYRKTIIGEIFGMENYQGYTGYSYRNAVKSLKRNDVTKEILEIYSKNLSRSPTMISYRALFKVRRGSIWNVRLKHEKALENFKKAFEYEMNKHNRFYGKARFYYGKTLFLLKRYDEAVNILRELLEEKNIVDAGRKYILNEATCYYIMSLIRDRKSDEANQVALNWLKKRRCSGEIYRVVAISDFAIGKIRRASIELLFAIDCDKDRYEDLRKDYYDLGIIHYLLGCKAESINDIIRAQSLGLDCTYISTLMKNNIYDKDIYSELLCW